MNAIYPFLQAIRKIKNIVCNEIDPMEQNQLSGVYEVTFTKENGTMQIYRKMIYTKLKDNIRNA